MEIETAPGFGRRQFNQIGLGPHDQFEFRGQINDDPAGRSDIL